MSTFTRSCLLGVCALLVSACGGTRVVTVTVTTTAQPKAPVAPIGRGVPAGYRAAHVWRARLSGGPVAEVIVSSVGPPVTRLGFHSAGLRVLEWDPLARQWSVAFDAQKVVPPDTTYDPGRSNAGPWYLGNGGGADRTPLLDPTANVTLGAVRFARLLDTKREQLVFSAVSSYGGSGSPVILAAVDFERGVADVVYAWSGEGLESWTASDGELDAHAEYWTPTDAHCCPLRSYHFTIENRRGYLNETFDDRPWLGITVREVNASEGPAGPLRVTGVDNHSPARGRLRVGDVIVGLRNAPTLARNTIPSIFGRLNLLHAGDTAQLDVERGGTRLTVAVHLGSMRSAVPELLPENDYTVAAL